MAEKKNGYGKVVWFDAPYHGKKSANAETVAAAAAAVFVLGVATKVVAEIANDKLKPKIKDAWYNMCDWIDENI